MPIPRIRNIESLKSRFNYLNTISRLYPGKEVFLQFMGRDPAKSSASTYQNRNDYQADNNLSHI